MRIIFLQSRHAIVAAILVAASCLSACNADPVYETCGAIPSLEVHGVKEIVDDCTGPACIREGSFSNGADLLGPVIPATVPFGQLSWITNATSIPYASAPGFDTVLDQAVTETESTRLLALDAGYMANRFIDFGGVTFSVELPPHSFYEYPMQFGRWISSEWKIPNGGGPVQQVSYLDPSAMADLRSRDIREYCVARQAMFHQNASTTSMGAQTGFSFSLFGNPIEVGIVEPTVAINGPTPYTPDGSGCPIGPNCPPTPALYDTNAFAIPFLFGTRFTLWKGLGTSVSLPEIRYPVVKLTGGTEVGTGAECHDINGAAEPSKVYTTVTQANALASASARAALSATIPLFEVAIMSVDLELGVTLDIGEPEVIDGRPSDERLLAQPPPTWPQSIRTGDAGTFPGFPDIYNDGNWTLSTGSGSDPFSGDSPTSFTVNASNAAPLSGLLQPHDAFLLRALEDSDERASFHNKLTLSGGIAGFAGASWGPIQIGLKAAGTLEGHVGMRHSLSDAAGAIFVDPTGQKKLLPISSLTVTPSTFAGATIQFDVGLHLQVPFAFRSWGNVSVDIPLLEAGPYTLASYESGFWSEEHRLRLGTGAQTDDPRKQPMVASHFPNTSQAPFESFPQSIDECMVDTTPNPPPPIECAMADPPPMGFPPNLEICYYSPVVVGTNNPCNPLQLDAYLAENNPNATAADLQCLRDKFTYLCGDVSQQQVYEGQPVVAHVFNLSDENDAQALVAVADSCSAEWTGKPDEFAKMFFSSVALCDDAGNLVGLGAIVGDVDPNAPMVTPSTCL
ncbi:MAG TPA: hypothetical protein PK156_03020 [Polyangium sp.]|nr:hypothetical protein [Polyangium sp.]